MKAGTAALFAACVVLAGCKAEEKPVENATMFEMMTKRIDPDADAIWAIGNAAIDDQALIDPSLMTEQSWVELAKASRRMSVHALDLSKLDPLVVAKAGVKILDEETEGVPGAAQVQGHVDKNPDVFRALAESLSIHATDLASAADARNAPEAGRLINEMDGVCESCHLEFWYPEQRDLAEKMGVLPK